MGAGTYPEAKQAKELAARYHSCARPPLCRDDQSRCIAHRDLGYGQDLLDDLLSRISDLNRFVVKTSKSRDILYDKRDKGAPSSRAA
jgi:hypothetical protein